MRVLLEFDGSAVQDPTKMTRRIHCIDVPSTVRIMRDFERHMREVLREYELVASLVFLVQPIEAQRRV